MILWCVIPIAVILLKTQKKPPSPPTSIAIQLHKLLKSVLPPRSSIIIGENARYSLPNDDLTVIDPTKTGKGFDKKICNICHCLKEHDEFDANQRVLEGTGKASFVRDIKRP